MDILRRKQLGHEQKAHAEQLREEQKTHAESLELMREQLKTANQRLQRLAIGERSLARADEILKAVRKGGPARSELVNQLKAIEMPSVEGRAKAARLSTQQFNRLVRHLETHYVEIPAVQSQQQSPSVENANKKKVHM